MQMHKVEVAANLQEIEATLEKAVKAAGAQSFSLQSAGFSSKFKEGVTELEEVVTSADLEAQELILGMLKQAFPATPIIAEENSLHTFSSNSFFTVDPIDGTLAFSRGESGWGPQIGYIENRVSVAGAIYAPVRDQLAVGRRGAGCILNGKEITLNGDGPDVVVIPLGPWSPPSIKASIIPNLQAKGYRVLEVSSVVEATMDFLMGKASIYVGAAEKIWDIGGAACLIEQAGGIVFDYQGSSPAWKELFMPTLFARTASRLDDLLDAVKEVNFDSNS